MLREAYIVCGCETFPISDVLRLCYMGMLTTPIGSIVFLFNVSFKPAMRVSGVQEIDLTPF
jgi:hypothetical protein